MRPKVTSRLSTYTTFLAAHYGIMLPNYTALHSWSIANQSEFWESIARFFHIDFDTPYDEVYEPRNPFWKTQWFRGAYLNYAHHVFRNANTTHPAIIYQNELGVYAELSWAQLIAKTHVLQQQLIAQGVGAGDYVVCYGTNTPETVAAFLATNALGAVWSSCSPDFGVQAVCDRFSQLNPKVLFAYKNFSYAGKVYYTTPKIAEVVRKVPSIEKTFFLDTHATFDDSPKKLHDISFTSVSFSSPIWTLFSSGTTGKPKAIVHGTGHMLLEHLKVLALHQDVCPGDRYFWYSTTGWMMWNYALSSLLCGATLCLYSGAPNYPTPDGLWKFAVRARIHHFGSGAVYFQKQMERDSSFLGETDFSFFKTIGSTGSPLSAAVCTRLRQQFPKTQIISLSGGTDVCTAFVGGHPDLAVFCGEIQCKMLGAPVEIWNEKGEEIENTPGEMMLTAPFLAMPIYLVNDPKFERYQQTYFSKFNTAWNHGDWAATTQNGGIIIYGRSDATLNRHGVRIGTAELYAALNERYEIKDSLVVHLTGEKQDKLLLFIQSKKRVDVEGIKSHLRSMCSPRHVPDIIHRVPEIPYTISGKKVEIPVKRILLGENLEDVVSLETLKNPEAIKWFAQQKF